MKWMPFDFCTTRLSQESAPHSSRTWSGVFSIGFNKLQVPLWPSTCFRLALEKGAARAYYHGVAEEGVPFREIAEVIGHRLKVPVVSVAPEEAANHFAWFAHFAAIDVQASSQKTQELLGWKPKQYGLIADLNHDSYFKTWYAITLRFVLINFNIHTLKLTSLTGQFMKSHL